MQSQTENIHSLNSNASQPPASKQQQQQQC